MCIYSYSFLVIVHNTTTENTVICTLLRYYGNIHNRRKVNVLEMECLRSLVGVSRMDRVRNEEVLRRAGIEMELASRADQRVLRWFGDVERMDEYHMA